MSDITVTLEITPEAQAEGDDPALVSPSDPEKITNGVVEEGMN